MARMIGYRYILGIIPAKAGTHPEVFQPLLLDQSSEDGFLPSPE
jgi:hypothetical protein